MRGGKNQLWKGGGTCVPFFAMWPTQFKPGVEINTVSGGIDILPIIADICGASIPEDIDGKSLLPLLKDQHTEFEDRFLVSHDTRWLPGDADKYKYRDYATQSNRFRLVNGTELYDHYNDPCETTNIIDRHPELVKEMNVFYEEWWAISRPLMINEQYALDNYDVEKL